jgi:hypothetical protein
MDMMPPVYGHPRRPCEIGVAGYPKGHPLIDDDALAEALDRKTACASYITTQMCFDSDAVPGWARDARSRRDAAGDRRRAGRGGPAPPARGHDAHRRGRRPRSSGSSAA